MVNRDCSRPPLMGVTEDGEVYQVGSGLDGLGRELPDPVPKEVPVHLRAGPSLEERVRQEMTRHLRREAADERETPADMDDLEVPDDDVRSPYEVLVEDLEADLARARDLLAKQEKAPPKKDEPVDGKAVQGTVGKDGKPVGASSPVEPAAPGGSTLT